ncbi:MAG: T9SS type A sorting domain-containing protein, partial [Flavobacteriales bacterium]|nr:T9SS type A sorting domain-containing protein [Flavobacteriales bacterium]
KNYFEYDIYISTTSGPYFQQGLARIKYDTTAFQSNIVNSNKITVQRGALISSIVDYMPPSPKDVASNVVAIAFGVDTTLTSRATFTSPIQLAHVKMEIKDCQSTPNLSFESTSIMNFITLYNTSPVGGTNESHSSIDASDTENSALCQMLISGFNPKKVNGGTGDIVTISGSLFGSVEGLVQLKNADDGGKTWVTLDSSYDVTWTDTQIQIKIPSTLPINATNPNQLRVPGSGKIKIINQNGTSKETLQDLEIYYSWRNDIRPNSLKQKIFLAGIDSVNDEDLINKQWGYSFVLNPNINSNTGAKECVQKAIKDWVCATEIRWQIDNSVQALPDTRDSISSIKFGSTSASHVLGETSIWHLVCNDPVNNPLAFNPDIDITISNASIHTWMYDSTGLQNQNAGIYDFYSVILHELGHGHLLKHINDPNDLMYYEAKHDNSNTIPWTDRKTVFSWSNIDGGTRIVDESEIVDFSNCSLNKHAMIRLVKDNCSLAMFGNDRLDNTNELEPIMYPNPFSEHLFLKMNLKESLEIEINIFDTKGELIYSRPIKTYSNGSHSVSINTADFNSGFYIGIIKVDENQYPFKLIKQ